MYQDAVYEATHTLLMAATGLGPAVHAVILWPWNHDADDKKAHEDSHFRYGSMYALERGDVNLSTYIADLCENFSFDANPQMMSIVKHVADGLTHICQTLGGLGFLHFDLKLSNVLVFFAANTLKVIDFDRTFFLQCVKHAGVKACFFVNLLLISTQIRAYTHKQFADAYAQRVGRVLMELWVEALTCPDSFGAGASWITSTHAAVEADDGSFSAQRLQDAKTTPQKLQTMLMCMVWEYVINADVRSGLAPMARTWKWQGHSRKKRLLVPQMLVFVVFALKPIPELYRRHLDFKC